MGPLSLQTRKVSTRTVLYEDDMNDVLFSFQDNKEQEKDTLDDVFDEEIDTDLV